MSETVRGAWISRRVSRQGGHGKTVRDWNGQKQCQKPPAEEEVRRRLPPRAIGGNTALQTLCTLDQSSRSCSSLGILSHSPLQDPTAPTPRAVLGCGPVSFHAVATESQHLHGEQKPHLRFVFPSPHAGGRGKEYIWSPGRTPVTLGTPGPQGADTSYVGGNQVPGGDTRSPERHQVPEGTPGPWGTPVTWG